MHWNIFRFICFLFSCSFFSLIKIKTNSQCTENDKSILSKIVPLFIVSSFRSFQYFSQIWNEKIFYLYLYCMINMITCYGTTNDDSFYTCKQTKQQNKTNKHRKYISTNERIRNGKSCSLVVNSSNSETDKFMWGTQFFSFFFWNFFFFFLGNAIESIAWWPAIILFCSVMSCVVLF